MGILVFGQVGASASTCRQPATVLAAVKDKPSLRSGRCAILDGGCARRLSGDRSGRRNRLVSRTKERRLFSALGRLRKPLRLRRGFRRRPNARVAGRKFFARFFSKKRCLTFQKLHRCR
jgi:hypothetical protein